MAGSWIERARKELLALRGEQPGWGYRPGGELYVEPTVFAELALSATRNGRVEADGLKQACQWVAGLQQSSGAVGISAARDEPVWPTSHAVLLWKADGGFANQQKLAIEFLLSRQGQTFKKTKNAVMGHDPSIPGWPWVDGTHSWIEPTVLALMALRNSGQGDHARVADGLRMIRDRAIPDGGWNYGNSSVFGTSLRPQIAPTGLALLALAPVDQRTPIVDRGIDYLLEKLPTVRAAQSLSWGLLGLTAWGQRPKDADDWLAEAFEQARKRSDPAMQIGHVLLAADETALDLLGSQKQKAD